MSLFVTGGVDTPELERVRAFAVDGGDGAVVGCPAVDDVAGRGDT